MCSSDLPCPHGDVKCLLGDRMVMTSPSVVINNFISLAVNPFASSKQTLHISMHLHSQHTLFLSRGAQLFILSRASRERGLGDGVCERVATVHNTSPSSLGARTPRETLTTGQTNTHHCSSSFQVESPEEGTKKKQETLPKEQAKGLSRDHQQAASSLLQRVLTLQS